MLFEAKQKLKALGKPCLSKQCCKMYTEGSQIHPLDIEQNISFWHAANQNMHDNLQVSFSVVAVDCQFL